MREPGPGYPEWKMRQSTAQSSGPISPTAGPQSALANLWRTLTRFDAHRMNRWMGLRNELGVAVPAAIAVDLGFPAYAVVAGMGALNVAAADEMDSYRNRAARMLASTCLGATAIFLGSAIGHDRTLAFTVAALWTYASGMMAALGTTAADIGKAAKVSGAGLGSPARRWRAAPPLPG